MATDTANWAHETTVAAPRASFGSPARPRLPQAGRPRDEQQKPPAGHRRAAKPEQTRATPARRSGLKKAKSEHAMAPARTAKVGGQEAAPQVPPRRMWRDTHPAERAWRPSQPWAAHTPPPRALAHASRAACATPRAHHLGSRRLAPQRVARRPLPFAQAWGLGWGAPAPRFRARDSTLRGDRPQKNPRPLAPERWVPGLTCNGYACPNFAPFPAPPSSPRARAPPRQEQGASEIAGRLQPAAPRALTQRLAPASRPCPSSHSFPRYMPLLTRLRPPMLFISILAVIPEQFAPWPVNGLTAKAGYT